MNLLLDNWIPVQGSPLLGLKQILCEPDDLARQRQLALPRDDMELACLQLLISLVQVALAPSNLQAWRERLTKPLTEVEYDSAVESLVDWFDLDHPEHPFMQTRNVPSKDTLPIQKLMIGLPAGNNHSLFNAPDEVTLLSESAAVIALFNQAVNSPGISSGLEVGIRKAAALTLVAGSSVRETIWRNVMHKDFASKHYSTDGVNQPNWITPYSVGERAGSLGLMRGLFWQPKCIELVRSDKPGTCGLLGITEDHPVIGFRWQKQSKKLEGFWISPHTPYKVSVSKGQIEWSYFAFTTRNPSWEHCLNFIPDLHGEDAGENAAPVVSQWGESFDTADLDLIVGGYCRQKSNEEKIQARRHETYRLGSGWQQKQGRAAIAETVRMALSAKDSLIQALLFVAKDTRKKEAKRKDPRKVVGVPINKLGEFFFYQRTEALIHDWLREMTRGERRKEKISYVDQLCRISVEIYRQLSEPYCRDPALVRTVALARRNLLAEFNKMKEGVAS